MVVDGWQQGWRATGDEEVVARFAPDRGYRLGLVAGLLALLALALVVLMPDRRWRGDRAPALGARTRARPGRRGTAAVGGGVLAGWWGLGLGLGGAIVALLLDRRAPESAPWLLAAFVLPAAAAYASGPGEARGVGGLPRLAALPRRRWSAASCWAGLPAGAADRRSAGA